MTIASIRGIPIRVHGSWLAIYALITWSLAVGYFPRVVPELPPAAYWANGLVAAALLFVSILLHELSHSLVALMHGLRVRSITLHVFGGVSHLEDEAPAPRAEFLIAVVGPLTSFVLAGVLWAVRASGVATGAPRAILDYLLVVNVAVGLFNLIPGYPLDGGRLLRAAVWTWKGSLGVATWIASRVGIGLAFLLMAAGVFRTFHGAVIDGFWLIVIGLFLRAAADASYAQIALRDALGKLPVREVMARDVVTIPADSTITELVEAFWAHHFTSFPVMDDGRVRGIASVQQVHRVARERWPSARVRDVMQPLGDDLVIRPHESAFEALHRATRNAVGRLAVLDGARLVGYVSLKDLVHVLAPHGLSPAGGGYRQRLVAERVMRRAA